MIFFFTIKLDQSMNADVMDQQQQHVVQVQLAHPAPPRGSSAAKQLNKDGGDDSARLIDMCPSLYRAVHRGPTVEVMALLLQQHGAAAARNYQGSSTGTNNYPLPLFLRCLKLRQILASSKIS
jgi:hypothetical protein